MRVLHSFGCLFRDLSRASFASLKELVKHDLGPIR
jgi:hypothetical protein